MVTRSKKPDGLQFQDRDLKLLCGLFESRLMTLAHAAALYFAGKSEAAKKRLQKLKAAGLIGERARRVNEKSILFLTTQGLSLLKAEGFLRAFPSVSEAAFARRSSVSALTLRHELEVMDVKAAVATAVGNTASLSIAEFSTWPKMHEFLARNGGARGAETLVKPDGFLRLHETEANGGISEYTFFLEVDRSTETQETLVGKATSYLDYYQSGGFAVRNGAPRSAYKDFPFRVLIVLKTAERRNNTAERLLECNPPILSQAYLSTLPEVLADPLGSVWIRAMDYRNAQAKIGSGPWPKNDGYRRQSERDKGIDIILSKIRILED